IQQENNKETTLEPSRVQNTPFPYYEILSGEQSIQQTQHKLIILSLEQKTGIFKQISKSFQKGPKTVTYISGDVWLDVAWELKLSNLTTDSKKTFGGFEEIKDLTNRTFNHSTHMLEISKEQWEDLIQQENNKETTLKPSRVRNTPFPYYDIFKDISFIVNNQSNKSNITPAQSPPVILSSEQKTNIFKQILESLKKGPKT
ncbi:hypothetical protein MJO28_004919, partial [Puccinia striiformis f. sp. tritici]